MKAKILHLCNHNDPFSDSLSKGIANYPDFVIIHSEYEPSLMADKPSADIIILNFDIDAPLIKKKIEELRSKKPGIPLIVLSDSHAALAAKMILKDESILFLPSKGINPEIIGALAFQLLQNGKKTAGSENTKLKTKALGSDIIEGTMVLETKADLKKLLVYERAVAECADILSLAEDIYETLQVILEKLLYAADVSRVYVFRNYKDAQGRLCAKQIREATKPKIKSMMDYEEYVNLPYENFPPIIYKHLSSDKAYANIYSNFSDKEKELLEFQKILSILNIPITVNHEFWGFIGFDDCAQERIWKKSDISLLKTIARIIGHFFEREITIEHLRKSEEKYRAVAEASITGIGIVDEFETFLWVNKAFADMLGYKVKEMIGKNLSAISEPEEFKKYRQKTEEKKKGKRSGYESCLIHKNGKIVDIFVHSTPLTHADGSFEGTLAVVVDITASKRAMDLLAKSEKRYKDLILNLSEGIIVIDEAGKIRFINPIISEMLDCEAKELLGQSIMQFIQEDYHLTISKILNSRLTQKSRSLEIEFKNKYNERIYTYFSISRFGTDNDGKDGFLIGVIDITSLKKAEYELKKLDFQLQEKVKELNGLFTLEEFNQKYENINDLFKYFIKEIAPASMGFPEEAVACLKIGEAEFKNKENVMLEKPVSEPIRINGKIKGRLTIGYSSGSLNISEYEARLIKQYAERLGTIFESRENQDALRIKSKALETSISAFAFENMDGIVTYVNQSFVKLWGYDSEEEIIGRPVHHFFGLRIPYEEISERLKKYGFWQGELTAMKKDCTFFQVHESANLMKDKDGNPLFLMGSYIDVTETKKLQERLIQSERLAANGQLVAAIAHEINSPLQAITFLMDSLGKKSTFDPLFKKDVDLLKEAFGTIRDTVKDLLTLNRPGREKRQITNVNNIIEGTLDLSRNYLRGRRIDVECRLSPEIPEIIASPQHLGQLFLNLLNNSVEAMIGGATKKKWVERTPSLGKVSISSSLQNGDIMIIFEDNGPGIEPDDLTHVFDPFFTKKKKMGMGVGLSICYNIVKEHNGNISASNTTEGGARFTITFPLKKNNIETS